jgi:hypothetical protein
MVAKARPYECPMLPNTHSPFEHDCSITRFIGFVGAMTEIF